MMKYLYFTYTHINTVFHIELFRKILTPRNYHSGADTSSKEHIVVNSWLRMLYHQHVRKFNTVGDTFTALEGGSVLLRIYSIFQYRLDVL